MEENGKYELTGWGRKPSDNEKDVKLPSGQLCRVKVLEMEDIIELDLIDALDTFSGKLLEDPRKSKKKKKDEGPMNGFMDLLRDKERSKKLIETINKVIPQAVVIPTVLPIPAEGEERREDGLYVDRIPLPDRFTIFGATFEGFGGGMSDFREESQESVGAVDEG